MNRQLSLLPSGRPPSSELRAFLDEVGAMQINDLLIWRCETVAVDTCRAQLLKVYQQDEYKYRTFSEGTMLYVVRVPPRPKGVRHG